jgi:hypothetical protein
MSNCLRMTEIRGLSPCRQDPLLHRLTKLFGPTSPTTACPRKPTSHTRYIDMSVPDVTSTLLFLQYGLNEIVIPICRLGSKDEVA